MENKYDASKDFTDKFQEAQDKIRQETKRPNILVCGYTGSGKTSLIKAILGDIVPPEKVGDGKPKTMGYALYENDEIRAWDSQGLELGQTEEEFTATTKQFVRSRQSDLSIDNHVHIVWYTIPGPGARVTDCDINLIKNIFNTNDLIAVITKKDITSAAQLQALRKRLQEDAGLPAERIIATSDIEAGCEGCDTLVALSYKMLPAAYRDAFMEAQRIDREGRIELLKAKSLKARLIIGTATTAATGIGAIPIPCSDALLLMPVQVAMIASLAALYGLSTEAVKVAALPFLGRLAGMYTASSLLKLIPGLGSAVNAAVAGGLTLAMGWYVQSHFYDIAEAKINGQPPPDMAFDFNSFKQFYDNYKQQEA